MNEKPNVKPGECVKLGSRDAVVCQIFRDEYIKDGIEVVFIDDRNRAININVFWNGKKWQPVRDDGSGGYADNYDRLREYVAILRRGK